MTPLVLLPGMMCDERLFASQINELSKRREVHFAKLLITKQFQNWLLMS